MISKPGMTFTDDTGLPVTENTMSDGPRSLVDGFVLKEPPVVIDLWRIILQIPFPPEMTAGGVALPEEYRDNKEFASYVGVVAGIGPLCYQAKTRSDLCLSQSNRCSVGDWVLFGKHAGEKFRSTDKTLWVVLSDTEIIGVTKNPEAFECMVL